MGWFFRKPKLVALTGVGAVLTASHRPPHSIGDIHEHRWEIIAWIRDYNHDALIAQHTLTEFLAPLQGQLLPDAWSRGEALARAVWEEMNAPCWRDGSRPAYCVRVNIGRPAELLYAQWPA